MKKLVSKTILATLCGAVCLSYVNASKLPSIDMKQFKDFNEQLVLLGPDQRLTCQADSGYGSFLNPYPVYYLLNNSGQHIKGTIFLRGLAEDPTFMSCQNEVDILPKKMQLLHCDVHVEADVMSTFYNQLQPELVDSHGNIQSVLAHDPFNLSGPRGNDGRNADCTEHVLPPEVNYGSSYIANMRGSDWFGESKIELPDNIPTYQEAYTTFQEEIARVQQTKSDTDCDNPTWVVTPVSTVVDQNLSVLTADHVAYFAAPVVANSCPVTTYTTKIGFRNQSGENSKVEVLEREVSVSSNNLRMFEGYLWTGRKNLNAPYSIDLSLWSRTSNEFSVTNTLNVTVQAAAEPHALYLKRFKPLAEAYA